MGCDCHKNDGHLIFRGDKDEPVSEFTCDCLWNHRMYRNTKYYQYEYCGACERIHSFHWKSFWKRLKCVFIDETI